MITMNELVDLRMQQHIAHEIYRHQIMQRIPGKCRRTPTPPVAKAPFCHCRRHEKTLQKLLRIISINDSHIWLCRIGPYQRAFSLLALLLLLTHKADQYGNSICRFCINKCDRSQRGLRGSH